MYTTEIADGPTLSEPSPSVPLTPTESNGATSPDTSSQTTQPASAILSDSVTSPDPLTSSSGSGSGSKNGSGSASTPLPGGPPPSPRSVHSSRSVIAAAAGASCGAALLCIAAALFFFWWRKKTRRSAVPTLTVPYGTDALITPYEARPQEADGAPEKDWKTIKVPHDTGGITTLRASVPGDREMLEGDAMARMRVELDRVHAENQLLRHQVEAPPLYSSRSRSTTRAPA